MPDEERIRAAMAGAERYLNAWHGRPSVRDEIAAIAEATAADEPPDRYGAGERIERFEQRVAELLGKEAAVFMPSGTMAQQIALRIWSDRRHTRTVAFHPTSHLELHEQKGYQALHGLHGRLVGDPNRLITLEDLDGIHEPVAALLLELPQREIGGLLPTWDDLVAQTTWAREHGIALHMDGARLWESGPFYGRPYAEIAGHFDSVYVSFYKGLGALAGAALAGERTFIDEARVWQRRHGGNLVTLHPLVVSAELGLEERLAPIAGYLEHAQAIAAALATLDGIEVIPDPPQTPMFHLLLRGDRERLSDAALSMAEDRKVFLFADPSPTGSPSWQRLEVMVGAVSFAISPDEARALFAEILAEAAKPRPRRDDRPLPRGGAGRSPRGGAGRSPRRRSQRRRSPPGGGGSPP